MNLAQLQQQFIDYLLTGDDKLKEQVVDQGPVETSTRLHIYANAYHQRLREVIDNDHPMLGIYLGDDLFEQMVDGYIPQHPSSTYSLRYFANRLPEFLRSIAPFSEHPQIAELARFERNLLDVFDAPSADYISLAALQSRAASSWPTMTLRFHPSVQLFNCNWNAISIWQALKQNQPPPEVIQHATATWILWRNKERLSEFNSLSDWQLAFLKAALAGSNFAELCELLLEYADENEVSKMAFETLAQWVREGVVVDLPEPKD